VTRAWAERLLQKLNVLIGCHFAGSACELPVLDAAATAHMTVNLDVVRRVKKRHLGRFAQHQLGIGAFVARVPDQDPMPTEDKDISPSGIVTGTSFGDAKVRSLGLSSGRRRDPPGLQRSDMAQRPRHVRSCADSGLGFYYLRLVISSCPLGATPCPD
jgi:hypothetical protein